MAPGANWAKTVRLRFEQLRQDVGVSEEHPRILEAIAQLGLALDDELPGGAGGGKRRKRCVLHEGFVRNLRNKLTRLQASRDEAKAALKAQTQSTQGKVSGFLTIDCLVKVCLASPMVSSWALYRAFRDVKWVGRDACVVV